MNTRHQEIETVWPPLSEDQIPSEASAISLRTVWSAPPGVGGARSPPDTAQLGLGD